MADVQLNNLRMFVKLVVESTSMVTRRDFENSRSQFHRINLDIPCEFKSSKMVDDVGQPIVFYHGTRHEFTQFSKSFLNTAGTEIPTNYIGFYFTTAPEVAQVYISRQFDPSKGLKPGGQVGSYVLNIKKPYYITENTYWGWGRGSVKEMEELVEKFQANGYDGIVMPSVWRGKNKGAYDVVVFDSKQIYKIKESL